MNIFGYELSIRKKLLNPVPDYRGWHHLIHEPFQGAWQRNIDERYSDLLSYPALYACVSRIAQDIAKLPFILVRLSAGIWKPVEENSPFWPVLRKPNYYQTAQQFRESWSVAKLINGNAYILKGRDARGIVNALYSLDPCKVVPLVSDSGDVFYRIQHRGTWNLPPLPDFVDDYAEGDVVIPAREIIHDRMNAFYHPLIGVPPVCAAHWAAVKNLRILRNASQFFQNGGNPGGILTAPAGIDDADARRLEHYWNENFTGDNSGRTAVIGADIKYTQFGMKAADSQLVEQMKYSDEQICQPFGIKPYKIGIGNPPAGWKSHDINIEYHGDALSPLIEAMENLLDDGLAISLPMGVEVNLEPLWRMDEGTRAETESKLVGGKIKTPDEARRQFNLSSTAGGNTLWGQHQDYPLGILAERDDLNPVAPEPAPPPAPDDEGELPTDEESETDKALRYLWRKSPESLSYVRR